MNFKHLFPTFRNRYNFVRERLKKYAKDQEFNEGLNLGTGEGDYDRMIASYCRHLTGVDVNTDDLAHAKAMNQGVMNLDYKVDNALDLSFAHNTFDLVVSSEVIEHVGKPDVMMREISRVLKPGGLAIMTFPSREFPFTYDPVNRIWQLTRGDGSREYAISQGAYAFGHEYLIGSDDFKRWASDAGLEIVEFEHLSGFMVGLAEMYWTGIAQRLFKKNAGNLTETQENALTVRPDSNQEPSLAFLTDMFLFTDKIHNFMTQRSVGKGVVLRKK
jgi:ubiquinone/menaquinone biosynthesis C-methylase UbiE